MIGCRSTTATELGAVSRPQTLGTRPRRPYWMTRLNENVVLRLTRLANALVDVQLRDQKANRADPYGIGAWWSR